jgi:hypothetical protein
MAKVKLNSVQMTDLYKCELELEGSAHETDEGTAGAITEGSGAPLPSLPMEVFSSLTLRRVVML